ncbi:cyclodeaminase/cyclohydrolase family protein [Parvibacter caecicola]|uniref:cyclodeaminase/cyclohydrolase family protein n=1 Tax=Parvibacter caecicola TaxID=747645 RepID=UPI00249C20EC|nr:cyclodeaminase/cyclohydrolase family protein [Parvibacter caecicola]
MDTTFIDELASAAPTPGGGGASAYCGALATALASMVGNLTVGKKTYAAVEPQVEASLQRLAQSRQRLLALVAADAAAFAPLAAAYRMPKETPQQQEAKQAALQAALVDATEVPLEIMAQCTATLSEIDFMARNGSRMACSDAGAAAVFAKAALQGAALSVLINVDSIANADAVATYRAQMDQLLADGCRQADAVYQYVVSCL